MSEDTHNSEHPEWGGHGPLGVIHCPTCWSTESERRIPVKLWVMDKLYEGPCNDKWHDDGRSSAELILSIEDKKFLKRMKVTV
jgi:hypothetical protein